MVAIVVSESYSISHLQTVILSIKSARHNLTLVRATAKPGMISGFLKLRVFVGLRNLLNVVLFNRRGFDLPLLAIADNPNCLASKSYRTNEHLFKAH
jgi:hypothetical protein